MRIGPDSDLVNLIAAIAARRAACGDDRMEMLPDDAPGVLKYLRMHRAVPRRVLAEDAGDALTLVCRLREQVDRDEYAMIRLARSAGLTWQQVAARLGLRTPQAAMHRFLRLESALAGGRRSEVSARSDRRQGRVERSRLAWAAGRESQVRDVAAQIAAMRLPDEQARESAEELEAILAEPAPSLPELVKWIMIVAGELRIAGQAEIIPAPLRRQVEEIVDAWDHARG